MSKPKPKRILEALFNSRARIRLLKFIFRSYPRNFTIKEVAKHLQENPRLVKKEVARLVQIGLLIKNGGRNSHVQ